MVEPVEATRVTVEQHALRALELYSQFIRKDSPYEVRRTPPYFDVTDVAVLALYRVFKNCILV